MPACRQAGINHALIKFLKGFKKKTQRMKNTILKTILITLLLISFSSLVCAQEAMPLQRKVYDKSLILLLELKDGKINLLRATKTNFKFRERIRKKDIYPGDIQYELTSDLDELITTDVISRRLVLKTT
jgi:hypothetical protein